MNISILGMGRMGSAIYKSLENSGKFELAGYDKGDDLDSGIERANIVFLAVKPQYFDDLLNDISVGFEDKLVISIMAGVTRDKLKDKLKTEKVIRSMPNLGALHGSSVTGWVSAEGVDENEKNTAREVFSSFGVEIELEKEEMLDSVTAISGSGPAYFFYLTKLLEEKAVEFGFSQEQARLLAEKTFIGSAKSMENENMTSAEWVSAVASKGGTTEAALKLMKEDDFGEVFKNAVEVAKKRSEELN